MEFIDLNTQQKRIKVMLDERVAKVLQHGQYIMGPEVGELEKKLAFFVGAEYCLGCASGTNALDLVLAAWGIGKEDAVFTTPLSFIATAEAIAKTGATPVFVDIDTKSFNIDATRLEDAIKAVRQQDATFHPLPRQALQKRLNPRAVVVVDLFGNPADYGAILPLAKRYNLLVLEDGAQAFGGIYRGQKLCNCGCHAATTSFFPAKPLGCYGDGGAIFTNDASLSALIDSLRYHGRISAQDKNCNVRLGCNGRLDTLQAAILLAKLDIFEEEVHARQNVAATYASLFAPFENSGVEIPQPIDDGQSAWAQYTVRLPKGTSRAKIMSTLKTEGIPTVINYPQGMHTQGCFSYLGYTPHDFPAVQSLCARVLSLPMHPYLSPLDQENVVHTLMKILRSQA